MVVAKCIAKNRNYRGEIESYVLKDGNEQTIVVTGSQIKQAMRAGKINIVNLQIDKAGRLVDKAEQVVQKQQMIELYTSEQIKIVRMFLLDLRIYLEHFEINDVDIKDKKKEQLIKELFTRKYPNKEYNYSYPNYYLYNLLFGNVQSVTIIYADDWCYRHLDDLRMSGDYTKAEIEELIEEEDEAYDKSHKKLMELIKEYEKDYKMFMQYTIEEARIEITNITFK